MQHHSPLPLQYDTVKAAEDNSFLLDGRAIQTGPTNPTLVCFFDSPLLHEEDIAKRMNGLAELALNVFFYPVSIDGKHKETTPPEWIEQAASEVRKGIDRAVAASRSEKILVAGIGASTLFVMQLANQSQEDFQGIIIEAPVCSSSTIENGPDRAVGAQKLIENITLPTLFLHAAKDSLVSIPEAEKLQAACAARKKQFFVIPGADRSEIAEKGGTHYFEVLKRFIDEVCGRNNWRERRRRFRKQEPQR